MCMQCPSWDCYRTFAVCFLEDCEANRAAQQSGSSKTLVDPLRVLAPPFFKNHLYLGAVKNTLASGAADDPARQPGAQQSCLTNERMGGISSSSWIQRNWIRGRGERTAFCSLLGHFCWIYPPVRTNMPFAKRLVEPQLLCRYEIPNEEGLLFEDLVSISSVALSRTLRQLSDLAKHACSIFQELESELTSTNQRVRGLQSKINRLQQGCSELDPKQEAVREYHTVRYYGGRHARGRHPVRWSPLSEIMWKKQKKSWLNLTQVYRKQRNDARLA